MTATPELSLTVRLNVEYAAAGTDTPEPKVIGKGCTVAPRILDMIDLWQAGDNEVGNELIYQLGSTVLSMLGHVSEVGKQYVLTGEVPTA